MKPWTHLLEEEDALPESVKAWPKHSRDAVSFLMKKYGPPDSIDAHRATWYNRGSWKRTEVVDEEIPHHFPKPHVDVLQQWIDYPINPSHGSALALYDGSVYIDRTRGELGARCDSEGANYLAINLAVEVMEGNKTVAEAREFYAQTMMKDKNKEWTKGFRFKVPKGNQGDTDIKVTVT